MRPSRRSRSSRSPATMTEARRGDSAGLSRLGNLFAIYVEIAPDQRRRDPCPNSDRVALSNQGDHLFFGAHQHLREGMVSMSSVFWVSQQVISIFADRKLLLTRQRIQSIHTHFILRRPAVSSRDRLYVTYGSTSIALEKIDSWRQIQAPETHTICD